MLESRPVFPARPVEVSREAVVLAGLQLGEQLTDGLSHLGGLAQQRIAEIQRASPRKR